MTNIDGPSVESKVSSDLFRCRVMPHLTTGKSPAEPLMRRTLRAQLDLFHPDKTANVQRIQAQQKAQHAAYSW